MRGPWWLVPVVLVLGTLSACSGDESPPGPAEPREAPAVAAPPDSGRSDLTPLTAPMRVAGLRWAVGNVPRRVPEYDEPLPSLLDDLPGRALLASYVPRPSSGFDGEAVELYGVDGRWRRLDLGDLDLPADGWTGGDTYGAGALSPDGRWWAGPMRGGMLLVDLRDGSTTVRRVAGLRAGMASFDWSPDSDELVLALIGRSHRVSVPGLRVQPFPRPKSHPSLLADGGWQECTYRRRVVERCPTYGPDGALIRQGAVPEDLRGRWAGPSGADFYSLPRGPFGNLRHDWELLRTDAALRADARLVLPARSEIDGVGEAFGRDALGLASLTGRHLVAWLVEEQEIVRVGRPGVGSPVLDGQDFWDVSFARDLVELR